MITNKKAAVILMAVLILFAGGVNLYQNSLGYTNRPFIMKEIALDTLVEIQGYGNDRSKVEAAVADAFDEIVIIDKSANAYDENSEISHVNDTADSIPVAVSIEIFEMLALSSRYNALTAGAFDVSIRPVVLLWDFDLRKLPSQASLDALLPLVNGRNVALDPARNEVRFLKKGMAVDLGGVAKGYAADRAVEVLKAAGIKHAIVTTGSTTSVLGGKPEPEGPFAQLARILSRKVSQVEGEFMIGIQAPRGETGDLLAKLRVRDQNISTSGDYQQFFELNGVRYSHILNPRTGYSDSDLASVTVVTNRSDAEADILSTALFVMGTTKAKAWLTGNTDVKAVLVDTKGGVQASRSLKNSLVDLPSGANFF